MLSRSPRSFLASACGCVLRAQAVEGSALADVT